MTKAELLKPVDDVIADCIRNDYAFGSYAYKVAEAIWPLLEAAEKERDFAKTEIARLHDDIRELTGVLVLDEEDSAHHKALAESALRVAKGWEGKCRELRTKIEAAEKERDALRAKVEAMERQEPVAWLHESRRDSDVVTSAVKHVWGKVAVGSLAAYSIPLYLAPGAKGE